MTEKFLDAVRELALHAATVLVRVEEGEQVHPHDEFELRAALERMTMLLEEVDEDA